MQTIGTYGEPGADDKHFNRPTFMDWFPDGSFVVADGYNGTRVVKFDKDGKYLTAWGQRGENGKETRPGYFNNVHGIAVDPKTRRVFVNDRGNHRAQVFDENGKFLDAVELRCADPSDIHLFHIFSDGYLWAADRGTSKMLKYDLERQLHVLVGHVGRLPRRHVGRARLQRRPGRQLLRGRSRQRRRAEVPPAQGRQSRDDDRQAAARRVEIEHY